MANLDFGKMSIKEKIEIYNFMGMRKEANKIELEDLNKHINDLTFLFSLGQCYKRSGGWLEPILEEWLRIDLLDSLKKKRALEISLSAR